MPKTYNARQIADMKAQAPHAAPLPDTPDLTRHVRFLARRKSPGWWIASKDVSPPTSDDLKPDTAYLAARALGAWANQPFRREIVREICDVKDCTQHDKCMACIGRANAIIGFLKVATSDNKTARRCADYFWAQIAVIPIKSWRLACRQRAWSGLKNGPSLAMLPGARRQIAETIVSLSLQRMLHPAAQAFASACTTRKIVEPETAGSPLSPFSP